MTACNTFALGALQAGLPSGHNLEAGAEPSKATEASEDAYTHNVLEPTKLSVIQTSRWDFVCSFGNSNA